MSIDRIRVYDALGNELDVLDQVIAISRVSGDFGHFLVPKLVVELGESTVKVETARAKYRKQSWISSLRCIKLERRISKDELSIIYKRINLYKSQRETA